MSKKKKHDIECVRVLEKSYPFGFSRFRGQEVWIWLYTSMSGISTSNSNRWHLKVKIEFLQTQT
jgi:hypothetical protein